MYKDILKMEYPNPLIWTGFDIDEFIDFLDNYKKINFNNVKIYRSKENKLNNFITEIDNKYHLRNIHCYLSDKYNEPTIIKGKFYNNIFYKNPQEYLLTKYKSRLNKMNQSEDIYVMFYNIKATQIQINKLVDVCLKHNYYTCIITDKTVKSSKIQHINYAHTYQPWTEELYKYHLEELKTFLYKGK